MTCLRLQPSTLTGEIRIPPSKSISHRAVICAALAEGTSSIDNLVFSEDISATLDGLVSLGTTVGEVSANPGEPGALWLEGNPKLQIAQETINCRESGSTLRFLIPLATLTGGPVTFTGAGKLVERPLDAYYELFQLHGIEYQTRDGYLPLTIKGRFSPGEYKLKGNVSSQFITGLMFLLPLLDGDSRIVVTTELESRGYVDLTINALEKSGITVQNNAYREFLIPGKQRYKAINCRIEGDYSQAAFWLVAGTLGSGLKCLDLNARSLQGDRAILDMMLGMGARIYWIDDNLEVLGGPTEGMVIDAGQCPDLVPVLAVLASLSKGTTRIINAGRLRIKESDRLKATASELNKLGARIQELQEGLLIEGVETLHGGTVDSWNDHRIAMAMAVASIRCTEPVFLTGAEAVKKSYPHFWQDFCKLGGRADEWNMG
ncbi:MAG: 3-phosphoshikimate 1-carboxyvinyltransferase [Dehalobacter sp. 4CP]|uniref:3-phosphoshikimate 1-carboxyvinyltransferase n=1 Tax=Dehalobacter sp. CP TaxID=2594474 RepID=UPI0013CC07F8|nr:3-phosphoshikimate 1-carboxyvinyltransferase [Dehalobacter sp.]NBJ14568.1 3-phosphoshikimate 1-carboxyvinyltransferase [Dehalobacter sp. 4CP]